MSSVDFLIRTLRITNTWLSKTVLFALHLVHSVVESVSVPLQLNY